MSLFAHKQVQNILVFLQFLHILFTCRVAMAHQDNMEYLASKEMK